MARKIMASLLVAAFLALIVLWLLFPGVVPPFRNLWELLGRPEAAARAGYLLAAAAVVFFLSLHVLKSGPL